MFLREPPVDNVPIEKQQPNFTEAIYYKRSVLKNVVSSAPEAVHGAAFINAKHKVVVRQILEKTGHKHLPTQLQVDNTTTYGVLKNGIQKITCMRDISISENCVTQVSS